MASSFVNVTSALIASNADGSMRSRAEGGSEKTLSDTTHTHIAVQDVAPSEVAHSPNALALDPTIARDTGVMTAPVSVTTMSDSISPTVSARIWAAAALYSEVTLDTAPSSGNTYWELLIDSTTVESISRTNASLNVGNKFEDTLSGEKDVSSGARTILTRINRNSEGNNTLGFKYFGMLVSGAMRGQ
ncbi:MAG: hypothetical protein IIC24_05510 [Chloroflexi bacterium]|nr:hypothetical protein [Chloroflexota bacterium]